MMGLDTRLDFSFNELQLRVRLRQGLIKANTLANDDPLFYSGVKRAMAAITKAIDRSSGDDEMLNILINNAYEMRSRDALACSALSAALMNSYDFKTGPAILVRLLQEILKWPRFMVTVRPHDLPSIVIQFPAQDTDMAFSMIVQSYLDQEGRHPSASWTLEDVSQLNCPFTKSLKQQFEQYTKGLL